MYIYIYIYTYICIYTYIYAYVHVLVKDRTFGALAYIERLAQERRPGFKWTRKATLIRYTVPLYNTI